MWWACFMSPGPCSVFCIESHWFPFTVFAKGTIISPIYKWANRGAENLRKMLRAPRRRLDLNPSLSGYKVLVFSNTPCCIYSTLEWGSGYPAQVGGKKSWEEAFLWRFLLYFKHLGWSLWWPGRRFEAGNTILAPSSHKTGSVYFMPANVEGALNDLCLRDFFFWSTKIPLLQ